MRLVRLIAVLPCWESLVGWQRIACLDPHTNLESCQDALRHCRVVIQWIARQLQVEQHEPKLSSSEAE